MLQKHNCIQIKSIVAVIRLGPGAGSKVCTLLLLDLFMAEQLHFITAYLPTHCPECPGQAATHTGNGHR